MTSSTARSNAKTKAAHVAASKFAVLHSAKIGSVGTPIFLDADAVVAIIPASLAPEGKDSACKSMVTFASGLFYDVRETPAECEKELFAKRRK